MPEQQKLKPSDISRDASFQMRAKMDEGALAEYADAITSADPGTWPFPPLVVFEIEGQYVLVDGFHRFDAHQSLDATVKRLRLPVEVHAGDADDALTYALGANAKNSIRRSNADKRNAVEVAIDKWPDLSGVKIAKICGVTQQYVSKIAIALRHPGGTTVVSPERVASNDTKEGTPRNADGLTHRSAGGQVSVSLTETRSDQNNPTSENGQNQHSENISSASEGSEADANLDKGGMPTVGTPTAGGEQSTNENTTPIETAENANTENRPKTTAEPVAENDDSASGGNEVEVEPIVEPVAAEELVSGEAEVATLDDVPDDMNPISKEHADELKTIAKNEKMRKALDKIAKAEEELKHDESMKLKVVGKDEEYDLDIDEVSKPFIEARKHLIAARKQLNIIIKSDTLWGMLPAVDYYNKLHEISSRLRTCTPEMASKYHPGYFTYDEVSQVRRDEKEKYIAQQKRGAK